MRKLTCLHLLLIFSNLIVPGQTTEKRAALIIGNGKYLGGRQLQNPINDAVLMSATLQKLGFETYLDTNLTQAQMQKAFLEFSRKNAKVNLIYYSGHGIQTGVDQYLVPVDADPKAPNEVPLTCINVQSELNVLAFDTSTLNIVILDACRSNPFKSWSRGGDGGFTKLLTPEGSIMAYATDAGQTADDNPVDNNGLYTKYLCQEIAKPLPVYQIFRNTRKLVLDASNKQQSPNFSDKSIGDFYFSLPVADKNTTSVPEATPVTKTDAPANNQVVNPQTSTTNNPFSINDVTEVFFKIPDKTQNGSFKYTGNKKWIESGEFSWDELNRSNKQIYLRDAGRGYDIILDLELKQVKFQDNGKPWGVLYNIANFTSIGNSISDNQASNPQTATENHPASVNEITEVFYYNADKSLYTSFINTQDKRWIEARRFHWDEISRSNNQIHLRDADGRNYDIILNLKLKQVQLSSDGGKTWGLLYNIAGFTANGNAKADNQNPNAPTSAANKTNDITIPAGKTISIKGPNKLFVTSENGSQSVTCDKATAQATEKFLVVDVGDGKVALQSTGKYVSSEDGLKAITCSSASINDSQKFEWVTNSDGTFSLRGNNGKYISSESGAGPISCNRPSVNEWEKFTYITY